MMTRLDEEAIRRLLDDRVAARLASFETFEEIGSTNSYLMQASAPPPGSLRVALTDNQTKGRGRHGRSWLSPPGSGLCLSIAYTFAAQPPNLPALTLATGVGVIEALAAMGIAGIQLKWPNDLVANDGKLGGILTEAKTSSPAAVTVVTGVGINVDITAAPDLDGNAAGTLRAVDLASCSATIPPREQLAAGLVNRLCTLISDYAATGFTPFAPRWAGYDWLLGKRVSVDAPQRQVSGTGAGIDADGALLVDTGATEPARVASGTVVAARETPA